MHLCNIADMSKNEHIDEIERAKNVVRDAVSSGRVTKAQIARGAGIHRNTMLGMHLASWNPTTKILSMMLEFVRRVPLGNGVKVGANQRSVAA